MPYGTIETLCFYKLSIDIYLHGVYYFLFRKNHFMKPSGLKSKLRIFQIWLQIVHTKYGMRYLYTKTGFRSEAKCSLRKTRDTW